MVIVGEIGKEDTRVNKLSRWSIIFLLLPTLVMADYAATPKGEQFIKSMTGKFGYTRKALITLLSGVQRDERILEKISRPTEKTKPWYAYRQLFITPQQVELGKAFYQRHKSVLLEAEQHYGVPPEVIVAILGVETRYGRVMGGDSVLTALATIAFDYPRREKFFTAELRAFLQMAKQEKFDPRVPLGSYAGAMGMAQFMPSSFLNYAVDYEGDGKRDLWTNPHDAIFSIANYLAKHGWQRGGQLVDTAIVLKAYRGRYQHKPFTTLAKLQKQHIVPLDVNSAKNDTASVGLIRLAIEDGYHHFLTFNNFAVITTYNTSPLYAMAVTDLANLITKDSL